MGPGWLFGVPPPDGAQDVHRGGLPQVQHRLRPGEGGSHRGGVPAPHPHLIPHHSPPPPRGFPIWGLVSLLEPLLFFFGGWWCHPQGVFALGGVSLGGMTPLSPMPPHLEESLFEGGSPFWGGVLLEGSLLGVVSPQVESPQPHIFPPPISRVPFLGGHLYSETPL